MKNIIIATRKSKRVTSAIEKMIAEGVISPALTWENVWEGIKATSAGFEYVYLLGRRDAVWGCFPCPIGVRHGNVSLSIKGTPYLWLVDAELPIEGEVLISQPSGAKYYLFLDESRRGENLDGYLVEHGTWEVTQSHLVPWQTVREAGV